MEETNPKGALKKADASQCMSQGAEYIEDGMTQAMNLFRGTTSVITTSQCLFLADLESFSAKRIKRKVAECRKQAQEKMANVQKEMLSKSGIFMSPTVNLSSVVKRCESLQQSVNLVQDIRTCDTSKKIVSLTLE